MDYRGDQPQHVGVLIRGANGELWVLRDDAAPKKVDPQVARKLEELLPKGEQEAVFTFPVPQEVLGILEAADFGPLFWCWVFCAVPRLR